MTRDVFALILRFAVIMSIQVFVLGNVQIGGMLNPYLYVYLIIFLPLDFSPNGGLLFAFTTGLIIDIFSQTLGMHIISSVFLAYSRLYVLQYMAPRDGYEFTRTISLKKMGWLWFFTYTGILVFLHHFILFFIESFRMSGLGFTIMKALGSSVLTLLLVLVVQLLFAPQGKDSKGYE